MKYLLAIDAGTGSIRAVLFDTKGKQIEVSQREWTHLEEPNVINSMSFDFNSNWELTKTCIKEVIENSHVNPDDIQWIMPRDAWLIDRKNTQPTEAFFVDSIGAQA